MVEFVDVFAQALDFRSRTTFLFLNSMTYLGGLPPWLNLKARDFCSQMDNPLFISKTCPGPPPEPSIAAAGTAAHSKGLSLLPGGYIPHTPVNRGTGRHPPKGTPFHPRPHRSLNPRTLQRDRARRERLWRLVLLFCFPEPKSRGDQNDEKSER